MRSVFGILLAGAVLALTVGCGKKDPTGSGGGGGGGGGGLEGTYLITGMSMFGENMPDEELKKQPEKERTVTVTADKIVFASFMGGNEKTDTYKTDTSKSPAHIDIVSKKSNGMDNNQYGVFKLDGDILTIHVSDSPEDRPKDFKLVFDEKAKKMSMMMTLTKKK